MIDDYVFNGHCYAGYAYVYRYIIELELGKHQSVEKPSAGLVGEFEGIK